MLIMCACHKNVHFIVIYKLHVTGFFSYAAYTFKWREKINVTSMQRSSYKSHKKTLSQLNQTSTKPLFYLLSLQPFQFLPTIQHYCSYDYTNIR